MLLAFVLWIIMERACSVDPAGVLGLGSCGFPGAPAYGRADTADKVAYEAGAILKYRCNDGFVLFGEDSRGCRENGTWSGTVPVCKKNIGLGQQTLQSATLWSYNPGLAVDNNVDTCSFTPRSTDQRWWQVHLGEPTNIESVAISISPGSYQKFTIFIIELLEGNKALYKPCSSFKGQFISHRAVFLCNDGLGHTGQFVYIRDDREEQEYFGLCEVQVFPAMNSTECGDPEVPLGSLLHRTEYSVNYSCQPGYTLTGEAVRHCGSDGQWGGLPPACTELECVDPMSPKNGYIEVSNFRGRYQYGSVATYKCNPGFILWGNASRMCNTAGEWDGTAPLCQPITCGQPAQIENSVHELVNGSTTWNSLAVYSCNNGFTNSLPENESLTVSACTLDGTWTKPNFNCYYDPIASANNFKKGRSLVDWTVEPGGQINIGTLIAIGVLSSLLVLSLIIVIIIITHRRSQIQANSRKSSKSSSDQLILDLANTSRDQKDHGSGLVVYDDLNHPHPVDTDPTLQQDAGQDDRYASGADQYAEDAYCLDNSNYQQTSLSTFHRKFSPGRNRETTKTSRQSPVSERSSGDGGSDRDGHYSALAGTGEYQCQTASLQQDGSFNTYSSVRFGDTPYSTIRRPDGSAEEDPYSSVHVRRDYVDETTYETLEREQTYEQIRRYKDPDRSASSGTSSASQATVLMASSDQDVQALYARVDMSKKQRNRNSDSSISPSSDPGVHNPCSTPGVNNPCSTPWAPQSSDISPTKKLIHKFNNISGFQDDPATRGLEHSRSSERMAAVNLSVVNLADPPARKLAPVNFFTLGHPRARTTPLASPRTTRAVTKYKEPSEEFSPNRVEIQQQIRAENIVKSKGITDVGTSIFTRTYDRGSLRTTNI